MPEPIPLGEVVRELNTAIHATWTTYNKIAPPFSPALIADPKLIAPDTCAMHDSLGFACGQPATHRIGIRHTEPPGCATWDKPSALCEEHVTYALASTKWTCNRCGAPAMLTEPVEIRREV